MSLSITARRAVLLAIRDQVDANGGGALQIHGSTMPPTTESIAMAPPLAIVVLAAVCCTLDAAPAVQMTLVEAVGNVAVAGTPVWARLVDGIGTAVYDCSAGLPGSGAQVIVTDGKVTPSDQMYVGGQITVNAVFTDV